MDGMPDWYWIRESGSCSALELPALARSFTQPQDRAVAFYINRFQAANCGHVPALLDTPETLLEVRIFREEAEFWAHRTDLSADFNWRIADDNTLWEKSPETDFDALKEQYIMETFQLLDISPEYAPYMDGEIDAFGCRKLRSSVGGHYALPLDDMSSGIRKQYGYVRLVNYLSYSADGIAGVADFRLAGFKPLSGEEASNEIRR